jgi:hypothetical protein
VLNPTEDAHTFGMSIFENDEHLQRDYLFLGLLAFTVDLTEPLELTFVFAASTVARRLSALSVRAASRALCAALRWLARRFISFALCAPRIGSSIDLGVLQPSAPR